MQSDWMRLLKLKDAMSKMLSLTPRSFLDWQVEVWPISEPYKVKVTSRQILAIQKCNVSPKTVQSPKAAQESNNQM